MRRPGAVPDSPAPAFAIRPPSVSLPKGGGAIRGIGETFAANPVTGTGAMSVPIATSPGRGGFGPQLSLSYDSGAGNGPFGLGWSLNLPAITRKTDRGLPRYLDEADSDTFLLAGAEDLVPWLDDDGGRPPDERVRVYGQDYLIRRYLPRTEGAFARIERWSDASDPAHAFWRTISRDNVTSWYGRSPESRVVDPDAPARIFQWFLCETHDDKGNAAVYRYKPEDGAGVARTLVFEANRPARARDAATYIASIHYGNRAPFLPTLAAEGAAWREAPSDPDAWMFEVRFDYGDLPAPDPQEDGALQPELGGRGTWTLRRDPFSSHRPGFELRTWRLCRRVLMLHHFPDAETGPHCLVRSTDLAYAEPSEDGLRDPEAPGYTTLVKVTQRGYERRLPPPAPREGYHWRALPALEFAYSAPAIDGETRLIAATDLPNLPTGTFGPGCQWVDLDGEGMSGVLCTQGGAAHYAPNRGGGRFGPSRVVAPVPAMASADGGWQLMDLAGDGRIDLVTFDGAAPGFHERDGDGGWTRHVPFADLPNLDWRDPDLRFLDLTGDGHADAVITGDRVFTWHPSREERGFGPGLRARQAADEDAGPRLAFSDASETIFLADMCGDGLTDLVRIRNGEVCYWPNLGYGRFGPKVSMANAPRFDAPDLFDPARLRLADIDGSGPTDIIYLGRTGAQLHFNRSGNSLSDARVVPLPVAAGNVGGVQVADLLGTGTACLVWTSHLPADASHPVRYVDLMAAGKPHLLTRAVNNLGGATEIAYTPSTRFYLDDLAAGRPWRTRLPFPVHCVSRVTVRDAWRGTAFSSTYSYHHGCFDGREREFRGFGRVEQIDLDAFGAEDNAASPWVTEERRLFQAPVKTVTWFHTGLAAEDGGHPGGYADEYFPARFAARLPGGSGAFREKPPSDPELPPDLEPGERHEALRACRGMMLRQEVYELDLEEFVGPGHRQREVRLFSVATRSCRVRRLQPRGGNPHAVFVVNEVEAITYHHELVIPAGGAPLAPDPRIAQTLNLRHDALGHVEQAVTIGYPRGAPGSYPGLPDPARIAEVQAEMHASYLETRHTGDVLLPAREGDPLSPLRHHRLRLPCETLSYALTGLERPAGGYVSAEDLRLHRLSEDQTRFPASGAAADQRPVTSLLYHEQPADRPGQPADRTPHRRIVAHRRTLFFDDAADDAAPTDPLPLGQVGPRALACESYALALTDALLTAVLGDKLDWAAEAAGPGASGRTCREMLNEPDRSGYVAGSNTGPGGRAGELWARSGVAGFAPDAHLRFFLPERFTDSFGNGTTVAYDPHHLHIAGITDARGNPTRVRRFDHRVLAPVDVEDANGNRVEIVHDVLGMVVAMAVRGKGLPGEPALDTLDGFDFDARNPPAALVDAFCRSPGFADGEEQRARLWLGGATARFVHHFGGPYYARGLPLPGAGMACACAILRETHAGRLANGGEARLQVALDCSDGSGGVLMRKIEAEPDPAAPGTRRWLVNGFTVLNNKGNPVRLFEPAFTPRFGCEMPEAGGPSTTLFHDAVGRVVRTDMPDGTFSRVEFSPWDSAAWDANDTVTESAWYRRNGRDRLDPAEALPRDPMTMQPAWTDEERAGWLAARHAGTPARTILDSLGRAVIAVAHNRERDPSGPLAFGGETWRDVLSATFTKLDAEGRPLWVRDARGHLVMQYITPPRATEAAGETMPAGAVPCHDMRGNLLFQHGMDAGARWMLNDAAGRPLFAWDLYRAEDLASAPARRRLYRTDHDALGRPLRHWLKTDDEAPRLIEVFAYCDTDAPRDAAGGLALPEARRRNLIGALVAHRDPSGLATVERVDTSSGNPAHVTRRLIRPGAGDAEGVVDWTAGDAPLLEDAAETFHRIADHDALGRVTRLFGWHRDITFGAPGGPAPTPGLTDRVAVHEPVYNARGLLASARLHLRARKTRAGGVTGFAPDPARSVSAIEAVAYDAKGQRLSLRRGNGTTTTYAYDPENFRLTGLATLRASDGKAMQRLAYVYDPVGNVTTLRDAAQDTVFRANDVIRPEHHYTYDALDRLTEATGRENAAAAPPRRREGAWPPGGFPAEDAPRAYRQRYVYDAVGNFERVVHVADGGNWTRHHETRPGSNRLARTWYADRVGEAVDYAYDSHGNMLNLNRRQPPAPVDPDEDWGRQIGWDWRDMIHRFDAIGGGVARYHYAIDRQRTRKHVTRIGGGVEDRIYLDGCELYRRRTPQGEIVEEIETHHLFDSGERVLLVDDVLQARDQPGPSGLRVRARTLWRYQYGNHLGSVGLELDEAARVISCEEFHPYGTVAFRLMGAAIEAPAKRYRYTGMERDEESGADYFGARFYLAAIGIWASPDPTSITNGLNVYQYCSSNPASRRDRNGEEDELVCRESNLFYDFDHFQAKIDHPKLASKASNLGFMLADENRRKGRTAFRNLPALQAPISLADARIKGGKQYRDAVSSMLSGRRFSEVVELNELWQLASKKETNTYDTSQDNFRRMIAESKLPAAAEVRDAFRHAGIDIVPNESSYRFRLNDTAYRRASRALNSAGLTFKDIRERLNRSGSGKLAAALLMASAAVAQAESATYEAAATKAAEDMQSESFQQLLSDSLEKDPTRGVLIVTVFHFNRPNQEAAKTVFFASNLIVAGDNPDDAWQTFMRQPSMQSVMPGVEDEHVAVQKTWIPALASPVRLEELR